jgi:hypothetical protein
MNGNLKQHEPIRIAMWSGPRNISTAMMRSWGSRADCAVVDEPLYAHFLSQIEEEKRSEHPVYNEVMRSQSTDWRSVAQTLNGPIPGCKPIWYQKHMAHHLTEVCEWDWIPSLTNCFLIREPAAMITSFIKIIENPTPEDLGLPQQVKLFEWIREQTGRVPAVIDSEDVLTEPRGVLNALCEHIGVGFNDSMLEWEKGTKPEDGVWGPHWYSSVYQSTGFSPYTPKGEQVPDRLMGVLGECDALYELLARHRIGMA